MIIIWRSGHHIAINNYGYTVATEQNIRALFMPLFVTVCWLLSVDNARKEDVHCMPEARTHIMTECQYASMRLDIMFIHNTFMYTYLHQIVLQPLWYTTRYDIMQHCGYLRCEGRVNGLIVAYILDCYEIVVCCIYLLGCLPGCYEIVAYISCVFMRLLHIYSGLLWNCCISVQCCHQMLSNECDISHRYHTALYLTYPGLL